MKKRGLRNCYALGGILDADDPFAPDPKADLLSRGQDMIDSARRNSGLSGRQRLAAMGSVGGSMTALGGTPDYGMTLPGGISARQRANFGAMAFGQDVTRMRRRSNDPVDPASPDIGFAEGTLDAAAAAKAQADAIAAKYGISGNTPAPAPAPAPVQQAPVQAPPPKPAGFINGIRNMLSPDARMRAAGAADGAVGVGSPEWRPPLPTPKPITTPTDGNGIRGVRGGVAPDGTIRGPGTSHSDSIPAHIGDTEFNVANGEKLAILPAKVAKSPDALDQIEEIIEDKTGKPVNRGLRSGGGYAFGDLPERPVRTATGTDPLATNTAQATRAAGGMSPEATAFQESQAAAARNAGPVRPANIPAAAEPVTAAPKPMMEPLEVPAAKPAAPAPRTGIAGQFDKVKAVGGNILDKAKSFTGGGAEATKQAAKGIKWYQPSPGVQSLGKVAGAVGKFATPLAMADTAAEGYSTPTEEYARRMGENAGESTLKDIGIRGAGIMADLGNKLTFGLADRVGNMIAGNGPDHSDAYGEHAPAAPKAAAPAAGGTQVGNPATAEPANPNIAALREAGVQGDVGAKPEAVTGNYVTKAGEPVSRTSFRTPNQGIRQLATANGDVYAGRDDKGQLNVTSNVGQSGAEDEAARAKEATRMTADLQRQKDYFANAAIESDLKSNNPADQRRGLMAQAKRAQEQANATNARKLDIDARGQDIQLLGHQLDNQTKLATLRNTQQQQNLENNTKLIDSLMGGQTIKGPDGKDMPNTEREAFLMKLTKTLGEGGKTIGHMAPQDFVSFHNAYQADKRSKGNTFEQLYKNWIDGNPEVDDYNPYRNIERAAGDAGKSNALKYYRDRNGVLRNERDVTGREFLTGGYDSNIKRQIDNR